MPAHNFPRAGPGLGSCYYPGPGLSWASTQHPCDLHSEISLCCPTGWTCFSNKLCIATDPHAANAAVGSTRRGTCTNPQWDEETCGDFCLEDEDGSMTPCGNDKWCCNSDVKAKNCDCVSGKGTFTIKGGKAVALLGFVNNKLTVTTGTAVPTSTGPVVKPSKHATTDKSTAAASSTVASAAVSSGVAATSSPTAAIAAADTRLAKILGPIFGVLGLILLLGLGWFFWRRRTARRDTTPSPSPELHQDLMVSGSKPDHSHHSQVTSPVASNINESFHSPMVGNMRDSNMQQSNLYESNMREPSMRDSNIHQASMYGSNIHQPNMQQPNMQQSNMYGSNMQQSNVREPNMRETYMNQPLHTSTPPAIAMTANPMVQSVNSDSGHSSMVPSALTSQSKRYSGYSPTSTSNLSVPSTKRNSGYSPIFAAGASNKPPSQPQSGPNASVRSPGISPLAGDRGPSEAFVSSDPRRQSGSGEAAMAPPPPPHRQMPQGDWAPRRPYRQPY